MFSAAPIYRAAAQAVIGGDISAAAACHRLMPWVVTVMTGTDGSSTPASSTTTSMTRVWVASSSFGTRRFAAQSPSSLSDRSRLRSTSGAV